MAVAHSIFDALASSCCICQWEGANVAGVFHFEVDTDTPIHCGTWTAHIYVGNSTFGNFGEDFPCALVGGNPDFGLVPRVQILTDDWGEIRCLNLMKGITLSLVCIGERDSGRVLLWH